MPFQPTPSKSGVYCIKVLGREKDAYWKYIPDHSRWIQLSSLCDSRKPSSIQYHWLITRVKGTADSYTIRPAYDDEVYMGPSPVPRKRRWLSWLFSSKKRKKETYPHVEGRENPGVLWRIRKNSSGGFSSISVEDSDLVLDCRDVESRRVHFFPFNNKDSLANQRWVFKPVDSSAAPLPALPANTSATSTRTNIDTLSSEKLLVPFTPERAAQESYDIIVVGTDSGAGVIAGDLFDTNTRLGPAAKSVLVIEKGDLSLHSHCLDSAGSPSSEQNDTLYNPFRDWYQFADDNRAANWEGGSWFNCGRNAAFPRTRNEALQKDFGPELCDELNDTWYQEAEQLLELSRPNTSAAHQKLLDRLNSSRGHEYQWQWGGVGPESKSPTNHHFARAAYSPADKLLKIATSKKRGADRTCIEHPNWKILSNTEVRQVTWDAEGGRATGVVVRNVNGGTDTRIKLKTYSNGDVIPGSAVVLGAGSLGSPAILTRSGLEDHLRRNGGLQCTGHLVCGKSFKFRYLDPSMREKVGATKLLGHMRLKSGTAVLAEISIDNVNSTALDTERKQKCTTADPPELVVKYIFPTRLDLHNKIELDSQGEPVITSRREAELNTNDPEVAELGEVTKGVIQVIEEVLETEVFLPDPEDRTLLELSIDSSRHQQGTNSFRAPHSGILASCVDSNLKLRGRSGLHVCDLSIFPYSPESNPTLTVVALALRLSRTLLPLAPKAGETYIIG